MSDSSLTYKPLTQADLEQQLVLATQGGLPRVSRPYQALADQLGASEAWVISSLQKMLDDGRIRRIACVPNHYKLGFTVNGMSVWDVDDQRLQELGPKVGALRCVSHCYRRPRHLPHWPYNFFAMVHGRNTDEVSIYINEIRQLLGDACRQSDVLYSQRILKKTGLRFRADAGT